VVQVFQAGLDSPELLLIQPAGDLLAITSDEGHGVVLVQQLDGAGSLIGLDAQFLGDGGYDGMIGHDYSRIPLSSP